MFREYKLLNREDGWFEILTRDTPDGDWRMVASVYGNARASSVIGFLRSGAA